MCRDSAGVGTIGFVPGQPLRACLQLSSAFSREGRNLLPPRVVQVSAQVVGCLDRRPEQGHFKSDQVEPSHV